MPNTAVRISQQGDVFVPDVSSVAIVAGDSVTFFADPDTQTNLCVTSATAAILSPQPDLTMMIAPGGSTTFEFLAAAPGNYCIVTQAPDWPYPTSISCGSGGSSPVLSIQPGQPPNYSGPDDIPQT